MSDWDYIIVGAGSAGCVLAERLTVNPALKVLLLEAGSWDTSPFVHMPRGVGKLLDDTSKLWTFTTEALDDIPAEKWVRGKLLGGSSSVNGMMYFRGQPEDYDGWEAAGARGWGWDNMGRAFAEMEKRTPNDTGQLRTTIDDRHDPLSEAFVNAGEQMGLPRVADLNLLARSLKGQGVGYAPRTVYKGRRQSASVAFLRGARRRPNLQVETGVMVDKVLFEGTRAVGIKALVNGVATEFRTEGEVIVSAGALMSPQILQRSGVGDAGLLRSLGIAVVADSPGVGEHMLEHRLLFAHYELNAPYSDNHQLTGWRLAKNVAQYYLQRKGVMSGAYGAVGAFARVLDESATADVEILMSRVSVVLGQNGKLIPDPVHSVQVFGYPLRSRSEGSIHIASADPTVPARIRPGYLSDPYDQRITVAMFRFLREWMKQPAIAPLVSKERAPTAVLQTDEEIIDAYRTRGVAGYHACSTCRMGDFADAVLDEKARVRGVEGLRVVDGSMLPAMVSANTNGPIMGSAWRAAELILEGKNR